MTARASQLVGGFSRDKLAEAAMQVELDAARELDAAILARDGHEHEPLWVDVGVRDHISADFCHTKGS